MPLYIGKKLDFLMRLTNTSNAMLGRTLNFDSSHISRIRADKRGVPHKQPFTDPAGKYFARALAQSDGKDIAASVICPDGEWPGDPGEAATLISSWLGLQDDFDMSPDKLPYSTGGIRKGTAFFYGNTGKREATLLFLQELCEMDSPPMLLLYSDEDMSWFSEDFAFVTQWGLMLAQYLSKGGQIRIIHNVGRDLHEMLTALQKWMPLYMYGKIESFYYPKLRDSFLRRTLFIAKSHSALVSNSIGSETNGMVSILVNHVDASKAFAQEFDNMLAQCNPLVQLYRTDNLLQLNADFSHFEEAPASFITAGTVPRLFSLPPETARRMEARCAGDLDLSGKSGLFSRSRTAEKRMLALLSAGHTVTDILNLPDVSQVWAGNFTVPLCNFLGLPVLSFTAEDLAAQLKYMIKLLKTQENYHVILTKDSLDNLLILCKENLGAFVFPATPHAIAFGISKRELTLSIWEFLNRTPNPCDRAQTIEALEKYIESLLNFH